MAVKPTKAEKKQNYDAKLCKLLDEFTQILVVNADNVGSNQLQSIRRGLRGHSIVLMGKNTMMKRSVRIHAENTGNNAFLNLIPLLVVSFFFSSVYISLFYFDPCMMNFDSVLVLFVYVSLFY
jgi:large subunit ribosomal protein LP0